MDARISQQIVLTKVEQGDWQTLPGGIKYKCLARGDKFRTSIGVAQPGGGETWHKHTEEVEETYYVLKGKGKISWKSNGAVCNLDFSEGDAMYLPYGIENMFINTSNEELWLLFSITNVEKTRE